jgi:hypothetical protein
MDMHSASQAACMQLHHSTVNMCEGMSACVCCIHICRTPRSPIYSDRFIPSRAASSRLQGFSLLDRAEASSQEVTR